MKIFFVPGVLSGNNAFRLKKLRNPLQHLIQTSEKQNT